MLWERIAYDWRMSSEELQERITSVQFTRICAYLRIEPRGYDTENWRAGMIAATVANVSGRYSRKMKPTDFCPSKPKKLKLSPAQREALKEINKRDGNHKRRHR